MDALIKFCKKNLGYKLVWLVVILSVILNIISTQYELQGHNLNDHPYIGILLSPFDNFRYGHFIVRKMFLVVVAFIVFMYWLKIQKHVFADIRNNLKYVVIIGITLFLSRILTYGFWFYNDDTRFFAWHLAALAQPSYNPQSIWGPIGSHPIALLLLIISWFGTNYALYNTLGLSLFFLAGVAIFTLANKLQNNRFVSLVAAIFLLTTPTYFHGRLLIGEVINSPLILLLIVLSIYMLLQKFIPGALIFAAAALEYGIAKAYFIALPLTLFVFLFTNIQKRTKILFITSIYIMLSVYMPTFSQAPAANSIGNIFTLDKLFVYGDVLMSVTLPYGLSYPIVNLLDLILNGWTYITVILGFLMIMILLIVGLLAFLKGHLFTAKIVAIGMSIILPCAFIASLMGVRVDRNILKFVEYHINSHGPTGATGYGIFPALGLSLILIGLGSFFSKRNFKILAIFLISLNIITSIAFDYRWLMSPYALPQRKYDEQLQKILPKDGIGKYIYIPEQQRPFYQGTITYGDVFQGDQPIHVFMDPEEFVSALGKNNPPKDHVYFLITNGKPKYHITNYSDSIRDISYDKLPFVLPMLTKELNLKQATF